MLTIGQRLAERREKKKISLARVHLETRISMDFLKGLESDTYDVFPADVYLVGFLKKYAMYLGLDPDSLVAEYRWCRAANREKERIDVKKKAAKNLGEPDDDALPAQRMIFLTAVIFIGFGLFVSVFFFSGKKPAAVRGEPDPEARVFLPRRLFREEQRIPLELTVSARRDCWVRIDADDRMVFEGILPGRKAEKWKARTNFVVRAEDWGRLDLSLNGHAIEAATIHPGSHSMTIDRTHLPKTPRDVL